MLSISKSGVSEVTKTISIGRGEAISIVGVGNRGSVSSTVVGQVLSISLWFSFGLTLTIMRVGVVGISIGTRDTISSIHSPGLWVSHGGSGQACKKCELHHLMFA